MNVMELSDPIHWWATLTPGKTAIVDRVRGARWSYADLNDAARRWAVVLTDRGVGTGDRVAVVSGNRPDVVALFYACARIGAALVPLNWRLAPAEIGRVLTDAKVALLVGESRFSAVRDVSAEPSPWLDFDLDGPALLAAVTSDANCTLAHQDIERAAMVLYTSGSTGKPKGAVLSHRQILYNAIATTTGWQLGADDIAPISTPFFHTGGWHVFATPLWYRGGTVVMFDGFDPSTFIDGLEAERCTVAFGVPTQLVILLESPGWGRPLPHLKWIACGGAPCPAQLAARVRASGYRLRLGFGMTEFGPNCFATSDDMALAKVASVGWPMPFAEMRIVDTDGDDVPNGSVGELYLRGPQLFSGYLHDAERSADALTADGWFRTGDLASKDDDGAFTIRGRRKDMFISGGENVFPGEVEAALVDCAGVAEAVVVGVAHERWGEVGHAFVQLRTGAILDCETALADLRSRIAHYKVPKFLEIIAELPRIGSGKIDRTFLKSLADKGSR